MKVIIAEKPSLGRKIASALGINNEKKGYLEGDGIIVTYAFGHLLQLQDMDEYFGRKLSWNEELPFYPDPFQFKLKDNVEEQFNLIKELINRDDTDEIICAGDADREGEVIIRLILQAGLTSNKYISRLWLPAQTEKTIVSQFNKRQSDSEYDNLFNEGMARMYIDWILGINLSRSISYISNTIMSIGRVICPIVIAIYERDKSIEEFVPEKYYAIESNADGIHLVSKNKFNKDEKEKANLYCKDYNSCLAKVVNITSKDVEKTSPKLFSLSKLQGYCGTKFKMKPNDTLNIVQLLYEKGLVTYPRTNTEFMSENEKEKANDLIQIHGNGDLVFKDSKRIFDDSKIESHSALTPTENICNLDDLNDKEKNVYLAILNRFKSVFYKEPCIISESEMNVEVGDSLKETIILKGKSVKSLGWMKIEQDNTDDVILPNFSIGDTFKVDFKSIEKKTTPPKHYTVATLGNYLINPFKKESQTEDEAYKELLSGCEIGTEATRAGIIDNAISKKYIDLKNNKYTICNKGRFMVELLKKVNLDMSPARTVELQKTLKSIYNGEKYVEDALVETKEFLDAYFEQLKHLNIEEYDKSLDLVEVGNCPWCNEPLYKFEGKNGIFYAHKNYKDNVCHFALKNNIKLYGNEIHLTDVNIKTLLSKKKMSCSFYSSEKEKDYTVFLSLKDTPRRYNGKQYPDWNIEFENEISIGNCPWCDKPLYKFTGKYGTYYAHKGKDKTQCNFSIRENMKIQGNDVDLDEKLIQKILAGKKPKFKFYSTKKKKEYEAGVSIKKNPKIYNGKQYIDWEFHFSKKKSK